MKQLGDIWSNLEPFLVIWGHFDQFGPIWTNFETFPTFLTFSTFPNIITFSYFFYFALFTFPTIPTFPTLTISLDLVLSGLVWSVWWNLVWDVFVPVRSVSVFCGLQIFSKHRPSWPILSISLNLRPCVCLFVCLFVCSLLRSSCPNFPKLDVQNI